ncbi:hypothetical protein amb0743 [Paramagnetospirillum magneticum AMB-1]|uniref:Flagellar protein FliL n=2 Tax=Paramagnetospirillum magneticum TaxID=84159 RepID=Q2W9C8_PARM1|nr:hypothetical protein amb0743 [Paramagnetospirillum magneticum AMB-1]
MMVGFGWVRLSRMAAMVLVLVFGLGSVVMAETAPPPSDGRIYEFPQPKPADAVLINSRSGKPMAVTYWLQARVASPQDLSTIRAMSDQLSRQFARLVGKHHLEDLLSVEQKRALADKLVVVANNELAAYDRRAGVAVPSDRVYVEALVFKEFSMEAVK